MVGQVQVGGGAPIVVQSMTNTDTADIEGTARQTADLARAGSELVRITVDRDELAKAVPHIRDRLDQMGVSVPLVGDFHYNGHTLLNDHPACAEALAKYRINPGNVGFKEKKDRNFSSMIETALKFRRPVRIGVNWGSLDQALLTALMDENHRSANPLDARAVMHEAVVQSGIFSAARAEELGMPAKPDRDFGQVFGSSGPDRRLPSACQRAANTPCIWASLKPAWARRHRGFNRGPWRFASRGHWRHYPHFAHSRTRRRPHPRSTCRPGNSANHGASRLRPDGDRLSRLWPHYLNGVQELA